jgi:hypothetical protein
MRKINVTNGKLILLSVLFYFMLSIAMGQNKAEKAAQKKNDKTDIENEKADEERSKALLEHQIEIQGKKTQKRMRENIDMTNHYYKRKLGKTFFQRLCKKKRKK